MKITWRTMSAIVFVGLLIWVGCDRDEETDEMIDEEPKVVEVPMEESERTGRREVRIEPKMQVPQLDLPNLAQPYRDVITSGQPTEEDFNELEDEGIKTVINLRHSDEEGFWDPTDKAAELGLEYVHIPVADADDLTRENVERLHEALEKTEERVLIYSASSDRVGAMIALREDWMLDGTPLRALQRGKAAGLADLDGTVRDKVYRNPQDR